MKIYLVIILSWFSIAFANAQTLNYYPKDYASVFKASKSLNKPILIEFYTDWCVNCRRMEENVFTDPELASYINENYIPIKLNAENFDVMDVCEKYEVQSYPTLLVLNDTGKNLGKIVGYYGIQPLSVELKKISNKYKKNK